MAVIYHDGVVWPHPPIIRCLQRTANALEAAGHTIVPWDTALHRSLIDCVDQFYFLGRGKEYHETLSTGNEPAAPLMKLLLGRAATTPCTVAESWKVSHYLRNRFKIGLLEDCGRANLTLQLNQFRNTLQTAYAAQCNEGGIDCILCPANASVASAHGEATYWGYTSVFNILDYTSAVFPVGTVEDCDTWERYPSGVVLGDNDERFAGYYREGSRGPEKYRDAPVALQLVGRRYREEEVLRIVERVLEDITR